MDVQADEAGLRPDPSATAVVPLTVRGDQGQLFADAYPTYPDTDQLPVVRGARGPVRSSTSRFLAVLVVILALAVLAAGAVLGLVKAGVIDKTTSATSGTATAPHHTATRSTAAPLVTPVSTGNGTATYAVAIPAYAVAVTTSTGRSWVSIGGTLQKPEFEGILAAGSTQKEILLGRSTVSVGAGGTTVTVTSGKRSTTLTPPGAPFSYQFVPKQS